MPLSLSLCVFPSSYGWLLCLVYFFLPPQNSFVEIVIDDNTILILSDYPNTNFTFLGIF